MIVLAVFCIQIFFAQSVYGQAVITKQATASINNGLPASFASNVPLGTPSLPAANVAAGLAGQMLNNGIPGGVFNTIGAQPHSISANHIAQPIGIATNHISTQVMPNQIGIPANIAANHHTAGFGPNYGGSGNGDVAVAGELPVVGTTAINGHVPLSGKVQFSGTVPAGGIVTITGHVGGGPNNGQTNVPHNAKSGFSNKPYGY